MLQKESWIYVTDNTNVRWVKIFHLYKGFNRKKTSENYFIKGSSRVVEPPRIEYKGFKYKYKIKGDIVRLLIVRTNRIKYLMHSVQIRFNQNSGIIINKKNNVLSKYVQGPFLNNKKNKKIKMLFKITF